MPSYQGKKNQKAYQKQKKTQFEETKPTSDSDMTRRLKFPEQEFKNMIKVLRALLDKAVITWEEMGNVNREMQTIRRNQKEMLEIKKKMIPEMKNSFYEFISRLVMVE